MTSVVIFTVAIALVGLAYRLGAGAVLTFWLAYILTRPLGPSLGDLLSQDTADGGLGLSTAISSALFLFVILALAIYLSPSRRDVKTAAAPAAQGGTPLPSATGRRADSELDPIR